MSRPPAARCLAISKAHLPSVAVAVRSRISAGLCNALSAFFHATTTSGTAYRVERHPQNQLITQRTSRIDHFDGGSLTVTASIKAEIKADVGKHVNSWLQRINIL